VLLVGTDSSTKRRRGVLLPAFFLYTGRFASVRLRWIWLACAGLRTTVNASVPKGLPLHGGGQGAERPRLQGNDGQNTSSIVQVLANTVSFTRYESGITKSSLTPALRFRAYLGSDECKVEVTKV
jgi:hypothetical protein